MKSVSKVELEALRNSDLFDEKWYLEQYPDVKMLGMDPLEHYLWVGAKMGRNPSQGFDAVGYLQRNSDVATAGMNPLLHYERWGKKEGRQLTAPTAPHSNNHRPNAKNVDRRNPSLAGGPQFPKDWKQHSSVLRSLAPSKPDHLEDRPDEAIGVAKKILQSTEEKPKISVIIPTYNRRTTVGDAVRSALNQLFPPHEIIISDDGSSDGTVDLISSDFSSQITSGLLKIVQNDHKGVSAARNSGLAAATGDLIAYLDSDNQWRPEYLLIMSAAFTECDQVQTAYAALKSFNKSTGEVRFRANPFDRKRLVSGNFIDLNIFMHRRSLYEQFGGFDEKLTRLVDWDLIVRYTKLFTPMYLPFCGVDYFLDKENLNNITFKEGLEKNFARVARKNFQERIQLGVDDLRIAYFVYDFPAFSQTFVINELRWLVRNGFDVKVFYAIDPDKKAKIDFDIDVIKVKDAKEFAEALLSTSRNICHGHFAYPGVTIFVQPACEMAEISYTYMAHAVDIFHHNNRDRSRLDLITNDERCLKAFIFGDYHRNFLESKGAARHKIAYNFQAVDPSDFGIDLGSTAPLPFKGQAFRGAVFARFIEKKGIEYLIDAAAQLRDLPVSFVVYGYGPLEDSYRARVAELDLHNIEFPGPVEGREALAKAYRDIDFLVAPCVEAANGDIDGFPTVILESMAAGRPVVTTAVSAIGDYLRDGIEAILAKPRDADSLACAIQRVIKMSDEQRNELLDGARQFLKNKVGVDNTMRRIVDIWSGYELDIFLVTYDSGKYKNERETLEIVKRILDKTTSTYNLTIVDNGSDRSFVHSLKSILAGRDNIRLIQSANNLFCGPASNLALSCGRAEFGIYICSKEGFIKDHGWERPLIEAMRNHPEYAIAGYKTHLPRYTQGKELVGHPEFAKFRNPEFAERNPDRSFSHVQGGVYIIRRESLKKYGWFNDKLPQANMDVEYSYFLESRGAKLGSLSSIVSLSSKTLPTTISVIDENTTVAHPFTANGVGEKLDLAADCENWRCNLCGVTRTRTSVDPYAGNICRSCESTPFGRSVGAILAHNHRTHRGNIAALWSRDAGLAAFLGDRLYRVAIATCDGNAFRNFLTAPGVPVSTVIMDLDEGTTDFGKSVLFKALEALPPTGLIVASGAGVRDIWADSKLTEQLKRSGLKAHIRKHSSQFISSDWRPFVIIER